MARMHDEDYGFPAHPTYRDDMDLVEEERERQIAKWGVQHHRDGTDQQYAVLARVYKTANDTDVTLGTVRWAYILLEEVYEALSETDPGKLSTELIQVAAVCVAWCEDIRSRESA